MNALEKKIAKVRAALEKKPGEAAYVLLSNKLIRLDAAARDCGKASIEEKIAEVSEAMRDEDDPAKMALLSARLGNLTAAKADVDDDDDAEDDDVECKSCGRMNSEDAVFCAKCGERLEEEEAAAGPPKVPAKSFAAEMMPASMFNEATTPAVSPWASASERKEAAEHAALLEEAPAEHRPMLQALPLALLKPAVAALAKGSRR